MAGNHDGSFQVFWFGTYPKRKRIYHDGSFTSRQLARSFCRNRSHYDGLHIVHPNGLVEPYKKGGL